MNYEGIAELLYDAQRAILVVQRAAALSPGKRTQDLEMAVHAVVTLESMPSLVKLSRLRSSACDRRWRKSAGWATRRLPRKLLLRRC